MTKAVKLPQLLCDALSGTQALNRGLSISKSATATITTDDGEVIALGKSEQQHKLFFKLKGCCSQQVHYRYCTPQAVTSISDLWCPFCMYDIDMWAAAGKALITSNELEFMQLLQAYQHSKQWCHQVRLKFWKGCIDFYNWMDRVCVQVDGACHWFGMMSSDKEQVRSRDLSCNIEAWRAGVGLVRVHQNDLQQPQVVLAAIEYAAMECCIVFTTSYGLNGCLQIQEMYEAVQLYCQLQYDAFGNTCLTKVIGPPGSRRPLHPPGPECCDTS